MTCLVLLLHLCVNLLFIVAVFAKLCMSFDVSLFIAHEGRVFAGLFFVVDPLASSFTDIAFTTILRDPR